MDPRRADAIKAANLLHGTLLDTTKTNGSIRAANAAAQTAMATLVMSEAARAEQIAASAELRAALAANNVVGMVAAGQRLIALSTPSAAPKILTGVECTWPPPLIRGIGGHLAISVGRPTAIVSPGGAGKGMLAMALAWSVATGEEMGELGIVGQPGPVLWLDYEETQPMLHARHARYRAGIEPVREGAGDLIHYLNAMEGGMTLDAASFMAWLRAELPKYRLCIVDHLTECWSTPLDWNQPEARLPLKAMTALSDATGCPFVALGHVNKPPQKGSSGGTADRWRGSTALRGAVISLWVGDETATPHQARWTHAKSNNGPKSAPFLSTVIDEEGGGYRVEIELAGQTLPAKANPHAVQLRTAVLEYVRANPDATKSAIRGGVGGGQQAKDDAVDALVHSKELVATPSKRATWFTYRVRGTGT